MKTNFIKENIKSIMAFIAGTTFAQAISEIRDNAKTDQERRITTGDIIRRTKKKLMQERNHTETPMIELSEKLTKANKLREQAQSKGNIAEVERLQQKADSLENKMTAKRLEIDTQKNSIEQMVDTLTPIQDNIDTVLTDVNGTELQTVLRSAREFHDAVQYLDLMKQQHALAEMKRHGKIQEKIDKLQIQIRELSYHPVDQVVSYPSVD